MTRSIIVGELRTGRRITQIPVSGSSWTVPHRATGSVSATIPLLATEFRELERRWFGGKYFGDGFVVGPDTFPEAATPVWRPGQGMRREFLSAVDPMRCFLAVAEDDRIIEAGPIWQHSFDPGTNALTVRAGGLRSMFSYRAVMGLLASWPGGKPARWSRTYSGLSLGTHAKRLVQLAQQYTGGELPIVLPADEAGTHERTYKGNELATVLSRLDQLMGVQGGPDIAFDPRFTADGVGVEWVMRTGTTADPLLHQSGDDHVWVAAAVRGSVKGLRVERDATGVASQAWETGAGMDEALLMARASDLTLVDHGFPFMESIEQRSTVERQATLDAWAAGDLAGRLRPTQTWSFDVAADTAPRLGTYRPGDWAQVHVPPDHPYLSLQLPSTEVPYRARIVGLRGGLDRFVTVTCMPTMEVR